MNKELKRSSQNTLRMLVYLAIVIVIVGLFAILPNIFSAQDMLFQTIAVVLSVVFTAVVTNQLLTGQSNNEESRERNIKVYENKISVYADFISKMWDTLNDGKLEPKEILEIRANVFNKLIFYLNDKQIKEITEALKDLSPEEETNEDKLKEVDLTSDQIIPVFQRITQILRAEVTEDGNNLNLNLLWNRFNILTPQNNKPEPVAEEPIPASTAETKIIRRISRNCIHFNIFGSKWQKSIFANGVNALGLCEYGEVWRTNLVKRCRNNEIVFLYKTGGPGYVGAFLAKGWVIFEADGNGNLEKEIKFEFEHNSGPQVIESKDEREKDVELFCAQELIDDGSTRVSYLLVEPLVYCEEGVGVISVYRRTISSYDSQYAWWTLGRFKAMIDFWPNDLNKYHIDGQEKTFNTNSSALQQIFSENNVQDAEWDDDSKDWKDK